MHNGIRVYKSNHKHTLYMYIKARILEAIINGIFLTYLIVYIYLYLCQRTRIPSLIFKLGCFVLFMNMYFMYRHVLSIIIT